eukprot:gene14102-20059_t
MAALPAMKHSESTVLINPVFEGSEKRLEMDFTVGAANGLRDLPRSALDELMQLAACEIVSTRNNDELDAYVLSESSLFVYPTKWVLKTCGTTQLLNAVPRLIELSSELGLKPVRCKYTRASFLFPEHQPFPHSTFDDEVSFLDKSLHGLLGHGHSTVLGEEEEGLQWHVFIADGMVEREKQPTVNFEMCMTELGPDACKQFFRSDKFVSTKQTTADSGILHLKPNALIDDYVFEPCGYSMNGIEGSGLMTIHVTPEPDFSYASLELSGGAKDVTDPSRILREAVQIFQPGKVTVAKTVSSDCMGKGFGDDFRLPSNYKYSTVHSRELPGGGSVNYFTMTCVDPRPISPTTVLDLSASAMSSADESADSPRLINDPAIPSAMEVAL